MSKFNRFLVVSRWTANVSFLGSCLRLKGVFMVKEKRGEVFPLVEAFGYCVDALSDKSKAAKEDMTCPFAKNKCEKYRQYKFGYCSVTYAARDDEGERYRYAVCDHRLDGPPLQKVLADHFGASVVPELIPEIKLHDLRTSIDYVAIERDETGKIRDVIAIETQAIDLRGGGVGPAWNAWMEGEAENWRTYFTREATEKGRLDNVAYGVNMANITKRLALQVVVKGAYLKEMGVPLYVVMQDRPFTYLHRRIPFSVVEDGGQADITFVTFDYDGEVSADGMLGFTHRKTIRTTLAAFSDALSQDSKDVESQKANFFDAIEKKSSKVIARSKR